MEDRTLPSTFNAATVSDLIADINAANAAGGTNTITLSAPTNNPYVLTAVDNTADGATGLPVIAKKNNLTIIANGDTIEREMSAPYFRLFDVAGGASLTLENVTLQNGLAFGSGTSAEGGGIYNQGTLVLDGATVQQNEALGSNGSNATSKTAATSGQDAAGGGIWSKGSLTLENGAQILSNLAQGGGAGDFGTVSCSKFVNGGKASGGGVFVVGGTANFSSVTLSNNKALGGAAGFTVVVIGSPPNQQAYFEALGNGGSAYGGALGVENGTGTVSLTSVQVTNNQADGGPIPFSASLSCGLPPSNGYGGGIYVAGGRVTLGNDTVANNHAGRGDVGTGYGAGSGGGICATGGTVTLSGNTVQSNTASDNGGGLYVSNATLTLSGDMVNSNTAADGGGLFVPGGRTATVTLTGVTLNSNAAVGTLNYDARGGGLYLGSGTITLSSDIVEYNSATAPPLQRAYGGGVDVEGATVNMSSTLVEYNSATGGASSSIQTFFAGGPAYGGGMAVISGTVTLSGDSLELNTAMGGLNNAPGGLAGNGYGGGLYIAAGTVTLCNDTVQSNTAPGGTGSNGAANGQGFGGGIFIAAGAKVYIDSFTVANTISNTDSSGLNGSTANIDGTYILKNC
jgi:hypothetical protein